MCYSAVVKQNVKELALAYGARIDYGEYEELFARRLAGEKLRISKAMEYVFTENPGNVRERKIASLIHQWHQRQIPLVQKELTRQQERLAKAEAVLQSKSTKKLLNERRIATDKIKKLQLAIDRHKEEKSPTEKSVRIYPFDFFSILSLDEQGRKAVRPARYHLRPNGRPESFDDKYKGCYNARQENLSRGAFWKALFGKNHGIMLIEKFFENVPIKKYPGLVDAREISKHGNLVVEFEPQEVDYLIGPLIWDRWTAKGKSFLSCALITGDPPPEVAAVGHNRCPVFLKEENVEAWLHPAGRAKKLHAILDDRATPFFHHALAA